MARTNWLAALAIFLLAGGAASQGEEDEIEVTIELDDEPAAVDAPAGAKKQEEPHWTRKVARVLDRTLKDVKIANKTLPEALEDFAKLSGVKVKLDVQVIKALPLGRPVRIDFVTKEMTARQVLGGILKLAGGLRYTYRDGGIYVSSARRVAEAVAGGDFEIVNDPVTQRPMTPGDAAALRTEKSYFRDFHDIGITGFGTTTAAALHWEQEFTDPRTGLTHFPGPPVIEESRDVGARRFWFVQRPYYIRPDYRGVVDQRLGDSVRIHETVRGPEQQIEKLLKIIAERPEATGAQILQEYRAAE